MIIRSPVEQMGVSMSLSCWFTTSPGKCLALPHRRTHLRRHSLVIQIHAEFIERHFIGVCWTVTNVLSAGMSSRAQ